MPGDEVLAGDTRAWLEQAAMDLRPVEIRLRGADLITVWTSRPKRVKHSNKRCSEIPRNRPFHSAEILGCVNPESWQRVCVSALRRSGCGGEDLQARPP